MKILPALACAAALLGSGAAFAEKAVKLPADLNDQAAVAAYTSALKRAVKVECTRETAPVVGLAYYSYRACIKATTLAVAKSEPTGLFASKMGLTTTLAAK